MRILYFFEIYQSLIKAAEDTISYAFQSFYNEARDGLKNASFYFGKNVPAELSHFGTLNGMFERIIWNMTNASTFMDAFASRVHK